MQEIKCPKCGEIFQVDESGYAAIVKQVRDREFGKEIEERTRQLALDKENAVRIARSQTENMYKDALAKKDLQQMELQGKINQSENEKQLAVQQALMRSEKALAEKDRQLFEMRAQMESERCSPFAMRARAESGSPWLPVHRTTIFSSGISSTL